ncbi:MAG: c-type cytochrome [Halioglobus sp.]|nr:c-type cytochrome [Halioglobus sp.]
MTVSIHRGPTLGLCIAVALSMSGGCGDGSDSNRNRSPDSDASVPTDPAILAQGRDIFRYDTFGDEIFWSDSLRMHEVIATAVDPQTALAVGLKVDAEALPDAVVEGIERGTIDLEDPATTVALLKLNAVVGLQGRVETVGGVDTLQSVGVTCALCHSTVDDSFAPGIGKRLDGWPNRDLDPGAIIALSPAVAADARAVYSSWGPGMYDARFNFDGINGPHVIPPAYGLAGINRITTTGDGDDIAYWNRYVAVTQMGGQGSFYDPRTGVNVTNGTTDQVTEKLPALQAYQLSLTAPAPPPGSFDPAAAQRGKAVFEGAGQCVSCHSGERFTDANIRLHQPNQVVSEPEPNGIPSYASRTATGLYRTSPLEGIWQHPPYFHNGIAPDLAAVVELYDDKKALQLSDAEKSDLVQYLKSL